MFGAYRRVVPQLGEPSVPPFCQNVRLSRWPQQNGIISNAATPPRHPRGGSGSRVCIHNQRDWTLSEAHMTARALCNIRPVPRRGLSRVEAALYLGISPSKFDELRKDGRVGPAHIIGGRKVWDVRDLDETFDASPLEDDDRDWTVAV
jgi:hypothetical protein